MTIIEVAGYYVGMIEGSAAHHGMIDDFNRRLAARVGYTMKYTDPWCAAFVSLCAEIAGAHLPVGVGVRPMVQEAQAAGTWSKTPVPGCYIVYDWDADGKGDHIGIVELVDCDRVQAIEGNYSDRVKRRWIARNAPEVLGYIHPIEPEPAPDPEPAPAPQPVAAPDLPTLRNGSTGPAVKIAQQLLQLRGYSVGPCGVDGEIGPDTMQAIRLAGIRYGLGTVSEIGPALWSALWFNR